MTRTGDREVGIVSGRLPDNPGELARMVIHAHFFSGPSFGIVNAMKIEHD